MPIDAAAIEAGLASPEFEKQRNMQRLLLGVDGKRYYGALCDVLASQNWQARGNAASLLSRIVPPSDAWCREALGRLIDRLDHEPVSDIRGVMERAKKVLEARIAHATGPVPNQIASGATQKRRRKFFRRMSFFRKKPSRPPDEPFTEWPRYPDEPFEEPSRPPEPPSRLYVAEEDGSIRWL